MTSLPVSALPPHQQARLLREAYGLMEQQVKSYHRHYHMGSSTSVPAETADELLRSIFYTVEAAGGYAPDQPLTVQLEQGRAVLSGKLEKARRLHGLVAGTVPDWQSRCHWETIDALGRWLQTYDPLHFAHRCPQMLDYPLLTPVPESLAGIDWTLYYLNCLWLENQLLQSFSSDALRTLYDRAPPDHWTPPQNLAEQPLWNAAARVLLGLPLDTLILSDSQRQALTGLCREASDPAALLQNAAAEVCQRLALPSQALCAYAQAAVDALLPRLRAALAGSGLHSLFF